MFRLNERVAGIYIIIGIRVRKTKANAGFITATLMQGSLRIPCVIWNDTAISADTMDGSFVYVNGMVTEYRNELQLNLDYIIALPINS